MLDWYIFQSLLLPHFSHRYGLCSWLFTPVLNPRDEAEREYNYWHRHAQTQVENTIGILKMRFR